MLVAALRPWNIRYPGRFCQLEGPARILPWFEMLEMNNEVRELAFNRAPTNELRRAAMAAGMRSLVDDAKRKILRGITTPMEIARITQAEGLVGE